MDVQEFRERRSEREREEKIAKRIAGVIIMILLLIAVGFGWCIGNDIRERGLKGVVQEVWEGEDAGAEGN